MSQYMCMKHQYIYSAPGDCPVCVTVRKQEQEVLTLAREFAAKAEAKGFSVGDPLGTMALCRAVKALNLLTVPGLLAGTSPLQKTSKSKNKRTPSANLKSGAGSSRRT